MRRLAFVVAVLACALALGAVNRTARTRFVRWIDSSGDPLATLPYLPSFSFANTVTMRTATAQIDAGTGLPVAQELCDAVTADDKTTPWECFRGDGTSTSWDAGTGVFADIGTVTDYTVTTCPNGPSCGTVAQQGHQSGEGAQTVSYASGTGHVSACWYGIVEALPAAEAGLLAQSTSITVGGLSWALTMQSSGVANFHISSGVGNTATACPTAVTLGAPHLICGMWGTGAGTGLNCCIDGVCDTGTFNARQSLDTPVVVHGLNGLGAAFPAETRGAFVTAEALSTTRIAAIARAVLADQPYGLTSAGAAVNLAFTRATSTFCDSVADGTAGAAGSILGAGRACIARQGIRPAASHKNWAVRWAELENASWGPTGGGVAAPTMTGNQGVAPDGTLSADRGQFAACPTAGNYSLIGQTNISGTAATTAGGWCKRNTGSDQTISVCVTDQFGTAEGCSPVTCGADWKRVWDGPRSVTGGGIYLGCNNITATYAGASNTGAADVLLWGFGVYESAALPPGCPTTSTTATCNADAPSFTLPSAVGPDFGMALSMLWDSTAVGAVTGLQLGSGAPNLARIGRTDNTTAAYLINATSTTPAVDAMGTAVQRGALQDVGGTRAAWWQGAAESAPAASMAAGTTVLSIGATNGIVRDVCVQGGGLDGGCRE